MYLSGQTSFLHSFSFPFDLSFDITLFPLAFRQRNRNFCIFQKQSTIFRMLILEMHLDRQRENGNVYWTKKNMAVFSAVADEAFVRNLVTRGVSHGEISDIYCSQYPHVRGLTERSVRRYCNERSIHRISNDEVDLIVEQHIHLYVHSYGRRCKEV